MTQSTAYCLYCKKPDTEFETCKAYPGGIPEGILHGGNCEYYDHDPKAPEPHFPNKKKPVVEKRRRTMNR